MATRLVLRVEVFVEDDDRETVCIASHTEGCLESGTAGRAELCKWAYEGFDLARMKFIGLTDAEMTKLRSLRDRPPDSPSTH
jgi:hypothetical protein